MGLFKEPVETRLPYRKMQGWIDENGANPEELLVPRDAAKPEKTLSEVLAQERGGEAEIPRGGYDLFLLDEDHIVAADLGVSDGAFFVCSG